MDFSLSVTIAGLISTALLLMALGVYYRRFREISGQLTPPTRRALASFGIGVFFLALVGPTGLIAPSFTLVWTAALFAALAIAQLNLTNDNESMVRRASILLIILSAFTSVEAIARIFIPAFSLPYVTYAFLAILIVISMIGAIYALKESPSPFTASMLGIIVFTIITEFTASSGFITEAPQFFILQIIPIVCAVGVLGSMLRPWRNILTLTMLSLIVTVGPALFIPAFIANNMTIFLFTTALTFALLCFTVPMSFFLQQAIETRATTARYISLALISIGLLALTHGNNYAIANSPIGVWDESILYFDWFLGVFGVSAFTMSAIASSFSANIRQASREVIIGFGAALLALGYPFVRRHDVYGDGSLVIERWELDPLYLGIIALLVVAFAVFLKLSYQLWKAGSGKAGLRFVFFMFAALFLGIVAMFADMIPL
ncbi:MAG: hypothetical protein P1Q69_19665, partial [Candidatus Thorarchaeota archaeon]|nr:hypothetical protein [Candidatus Thorarchaeota archaeon]